MAEHRFGNVFKCFNFLKWVMGNCVEKPNGLGTTVSTRQYFCRVVWASLGIDK